MKANSSLIQQHLPKLGEPLAEELRQLDIAREDCRQRRDPNSFYLIMDARQPLSVAWCHNVKAHLGEENISFEAYYERIHPSWLPFDTAYALAAYELMLRERESKYAPKTTYTLNVPLLNRQREYHWYNSVAATLVHDDRGMAVYYIIHFHYLCAYDNLIPTKPIVSGDPKKKEEQLAVFEKSATDLVGQYLSTQLSPAVFRVLYAYCELMTMEQNVWQPPTTRAIANHLGASTGSVGKSVVRIMQFARQHYPKTVTGSISAFIIFLSDLCGHHAMTKSFTGPAS